MDHLLETTSSDDILSWAFGRFGDRIALSTAFGPSGIVLMHLASQVKPGVKVFFVNTGFHFRETLETLNKVRDRLAVQIKIIEPKISVDEQASRHGDELYVLNSDRCCAIRKVEPTQRMLKGLDAWVTALRRDQGPTRAHLPAIENRSVEERPLTKINPLIHWTREEIWRHIFAHDLPYNDLHDRGYPSVGCAPCTRPATDPNDERSGRWAGQNKTECGLHTMI